MKRKILALAVSALAMGSAMAQSSSVTLYGLVDIGVTYTNPVKGTGGKAGRLWTVHPGAMQASRLGFRGIEDLGGGLNALFVLESGINVDTGTFAQGGIPFGRRSVVGFSAPWGTALAGRQTDPLDDLGPLTSNIDFGAQVAPIHGLDRTYADRTINSLRYNSPRFGGFAAMAMAGLGENPNSTQEGRALAFGADYTLQNLRIGAGYYESRLGANTADAGSGRIGARNGQPGDVALRTWTVASAYQWGRARLHASYSDTRQPLAVASATRTLTGPSAVRAHIYDVGVAWSLTPALIASFSVIRDNVHFVAAASGHLTQFNAGLDYFLSKRTDLYLNLGRLSASGMDSPGMDPGAPGGDRTQRLARVGIRHKF
jgi:predicted porin